MKKTKIQKGITLIALIITVVLLLILAAVTIGSIKENDLIGYAQNATEEYEEKQNEEQGKVAEYKEQIKDILGASNVTGKAEVGTIVSKNSTINGNAPSSTNPVIPAGFKAINVTTPGHESSWDAEGGPEVDKGLVIEDEDGNQFVWVPVPELDKFARLQEGSNENYEGVVDNKEPINLMQDNTSQMAIWSETLYQESFNKMVASVAKYKGFYVGRYETSFFDEAIQSKSGQMPLSYNIKWYNIYEESLKYSNNNINLGVTSEMIWGCQWDAVMRFIDDVATKTGSTSHVLEDFTTIPYLTGGTDYITNYKRAEGQEGYVAYDDIANNIYDLQGNVKEWTQEGSESGWRVHRGGDFEFDDSPEIRRLPCS